LDLSWIKQHIPGIGTLMSEAGTPPAIGNRSYGAHRSLIMRNALIILTLIGSSPCIPVAAQEASEPRQYVDLPDAMRAHMLRNMRDHLLVISEIQEALSAGAFDRAAEVAEQRIGMSSLAAHGASHMAPHLPEPMRQIGVQMHRAASQFAIVAQEASVDGDLARALGALNRITQQCVACHAAFRVR
jgi:hypothetical protein